MVTSSIIETGHQAFSDSNLRDGFKAFLKQPLDYRNQFLQTKYQRAFDGYSYLGQKDSINQYDTEMLHSFVLSDFTAPEDFPHEFASFFNKDWNPILALIKQLELEFIAQIEMPGLKTFYQESVGHMVSCNYYPKVSTIVQRAKGDTRLSAHKDVSLFSVFPFGLAEGLSYYSNTHTHRLGTKKEIFSFAGYLMEYLSKGIYKAIPHQVELPSIDEERFSFAFFSIVKPEAVIPLEGKKIPASKYYRDYLALF